MARGDVRRDDAAPDPIKELCAGKWLNDWWAMNIDQRIERGEEFDEEGAHDFNLSGSQQKHRGGEVMLDDEGKMNNQDYGRIIFWGDRGYQFIRPDAGDRDVFVHVTEYELPEGEEMQLGDHVTYEVGADRRHPEQYARGSYAWSAMRSQSASGYVQETNRRRSRRPSACDLAHAQSVITKSKTPPRGRG